MYRKIIAAAVLIAFVSVQLVYCLECFECEDASQCKKPSIRTCDEKSANATNVQLKNFFDAVSEQTNPNFECFHYNGTENNAAVEFRGCVFTHINACNLTPLQVHSNLVKTNCTKCAGNLCNGNNPAGTFSSSSLTLLASALLLFAAKAVAF